MPRRIVVMHQGALGDFILALPSIEGVARAHPAARIDLWSRPEHAALLKDRSYIERTYPAGGRELAPFFDDAAWRSAPIPEFLEGAGMVVMFAQEQGRALARRLARRLPGPVHWIRSFPPPGRDMPAAEFIFSQVAARGLSGGEFPEIRLTPPPDESLAVRRWREEHAMTHSPPVVLHPGSGGTRKIWPLRNWWAVINRLKARRIPACVLLGPAERALEDFAAAVSGIGVPVLEGPGLPRLSAFLGAARLFMGNDSGVTHLAAALGTPTIAVFGPTSPRVWAPKGPHVHVVRDRWPESEVLEWPPAAGFPPVHPRISNLLRRLLFPGT
ncbi:MAG: hypothetical protein DRH56_05270 [Deltaproteobacteria bacterium]|nr:MAG: hypothetical protein DRH56_05270 [Deltaproteobacteria bacterium]